MATSCTIGYINEDGTVTAVYVHNDVYHDGVGQTLHRHYGDDAVVKELVGMGDMSYVKESVEASLAYRVIGESPGETAPVTYPDADAYSRMTWLHDYVYLWDGLGWSSYVGIQRDFVYLASLLRNS